MKKAIFAVYFLVFAISFGAGAEESVMNLIESVNDMNSPATGTSSSQTGDISESLEKAGEEKMGNLNLPDFKELEKKEDTEAESGLSEEEARKAIRENISGKPASKAPANDFVLKGAVNMKFKDMKTIFTIRTKKKADYGHLLKGNIFILNLDTASALSGIEDKFPFGHAKSLVWRQTERGGDLIFEMFEGSRAYIEEAPPGELRVIMSGLLYRMDNFSFNQDKRGTQIEMTTSAPPDYRIDLSEDGQRLDLYLINCACENTMRDDLNLYFVDGVFIESVIDERWEAPAICLVSLSLKKKVPYKVFQAGDKHLGLRFGYHVEKEKPVALAVKAKPASKEALPEPPKKQEEISTPKKEKREQPVDSKKEQKKSVSRPKKPEPKIQKKAAEESPLAKPSADKTPEKKIVEPPPVDSGEEPRFHKKDLPPKYTAEKSDKDNLKKKRQSRDQPSESERVKKTVPKKKPLRHSVVMIPDDYYELDVSGASIERLEFLLARKPAEIHTINGEKIVVYKILPEAGKLPRTVRKSLSKGRLKAKTIVYIGNEAIPIFAR